MRQRVLVLCTHNSARSQMAEGLLRHHAAGRVDVASAGTEQTSVHPLAIVAMREVGIDMSSHTSKTLDRFVNEPWDYVITVCDSANQACPAFPGAAHRVHWSIDDPSAATGSDADRLTVLRRVRDELRRRVDGFLGGELAGGTENDRLTRAAARQIVATANYGNAEPASGGVERGLVGVHPRLSFPRSRPHLLP